MIQPFAYWLLQLSRRPHGPVIHWLLWVSSSRCLHHWPPRGLDFRTVGDTPRPSAPEAPPKLTRVPSAWLSHSLCCFSQQALCWELNKTHRSSVPGAGSRLSEHRTKTFSGLLSTAKWPWQTTVSLSAMVRTGLGQCTSCSVSKFPVQIYFSILWKQLKSSS